MYSNERKKYIQNRIQQEKVLGDYFLIINNSNIHL